jgi:hypothetical protein
MGWKNPFPGHQGTKLKPEVTAFLGVSVSWWPSRVFLVLPFSATLPSLRLSVEDFCLIP